MSFELKSQMEKIEKILPTHDIKLFSGRSNNVLAHEIAQYLGTSLEPITIKDFSDGEIYVQIQDSVRGDDVFVVQPVCNPVNQNLMELLILLDACVIMYVLRNERSFLYEKNTLSFTCPDHVLRICWL